MEKKFKLIVNTNFRENINDQSKIDYEDKKPSEFDYLLEELKIIDDNKFLDLRKYIDNLSDLPEKYQYIYFMEKYWRVFKNLFDLNDGIYGTQDFHRKINYFSLLVYLEVIFIKFPYFYQNNLNSLHLLDQSHNLESFRKIYARKILLNEGYDFGNEKNDIIFDIKKAIISTLG